MLLLPSPTIIVSIGARAFHLRSTTRVAGRQALEKLKYEILGDRVVRQAWEKSVQRRVP
jgi:hypothetical protein